MSLPLIVVLGAGRSSGWLVQKLADKARLGQFRLCVVAGQKPAYNLLPPIEFVEAHLEVDHPYPELLEGAFICISLLPPPFHAAVMEACLLTGTHFLSASYETPIARSHKAEADAKKLVIINEAGFDPGLDHVTALAMLERVKGWGGKVISFESDSGGLPAQADLNNWGYRFFWNPINVVLAGTSGARFLQEGQSRLISYAEVFRQYRPIYKEADKLLVAYPNRDSLPYQKLYDLPEVKTFIRGTIRYQVYCDKWAILADANVANQAITLEPNLTYGQWASLFEWHPSAYQILMDLITSEGIGNRYLGDAKTSAEALLEMLMLAWNPIEGYHDRTLMRHRIVYDIDGQTFEYIGLLDKEGDESSTAMAFLVGLPIAIIVDIMVQFPLSGVLTPSDTALWPRIYDNLPKYNVELKYTNLPLRT